MRTGLGAGLAACFGMLAIHAPSAWADAPKPPPKPAPSAKATVKAPLPKHVRRLLVRDAPPAHAMLKLLPGALGTPWILQIENTDTTPLRLVLDPRLLSLSVSSPPDAKARHTTVTCALPSDVRPTNDEHHVTTIQPETAFAIVFDPRFYCFDAALAAKLVPSAEVAAKLGWAPSGHAPPFVLDRTDSGDPRAGVKELVSETAPVPEALPSERPPQTGVVRVKGPARIDATSWRHVVLPVSVENTGTRPIRLILRPETIAFDVASPRGVVRCSWPHEPGGPIAEVFTTIPPHGTVSTDVVIASMCPDGTFDAAGLYAVTPRLDTRMASGRSIGIASFDGLVVAEEPTLVRVQRDRVRP